MTSPIGNTSAGIGIVPVLGSIDHDLDLLEQLGPEHADLVQYIDGRRGIIGLPPTVV